MTKKIFNSSKIKLIALVIGIFLFFLPAILFLCKFHSGLSNNIVAWNNTANYFNSIYTPILTFIAAIFVYKTYQNQRRANKISEFAFVSEYFKKELSEFNIDLDSKTSAFITYNQYYDNTSIRSIQEYNEDFIKFYNLVDSSSKEFILSFKRIENEINNYQIRPEPKYTFARELKNIGGKVERHKKAIENALHHLDGIENLEDSSKRSNILESCDILVLHPQLEQINNIIAKYELS
jgi:dolichyl-phosphate-mannose--protein O-mannosyl transferase